MREIRTVVSQLVLLANADSARRQGVTELHMLFLGEERGITSLMLMYYCPQLVNRRPKFRVFESLRLSIPTGRMREFRNWFRLCYFAGGWDWSWGYGVQTLPSDELMLVLTTVCPLSTNQMLHPEDPLRELRISGAYDRRRSARDLTSLTMIVEPRKPNSRLTVVNIHGHGKERQVRMFQWVRQRLGQGQRQALRTFLFQYLLTVGWEYTATMSHGRVVFEASTESSS